MGRKDPPESDGPNSTPKQEYDAAAVHRAIRRNPDAYPDGWIEQVRFRDRYGLAPFRPPRFEDGSAVHATVDQLNAYYGVCISFAAYDVERRGWLVEIDGESAFPVDRYRDDAANTVLGMTEAAFRRRVVEAIESRVTE